MAARGFAEDSGLSQPRHQGANGGVGKVQAVLGRGDRKKGLALQQIMKAERGTGAAAQGCRLGSASGE